MLPAALVLALLLSHPGAAQTPPDEEFGKGLILETVEELQRIPRARSFRAHLPVAKDLSDLMPTPGQQRAQSSCVGWAVAYAARTYHYAADHSVSPALSENIASPSALYNAVRDPNKDCSVGSRIVDALNHLQRVGVPSLAEFPYDPRQCTRQPPLVLTPSTGRFRLIEWQRIDTGVPDDVKGQIVAGRPVVIGVVPHKSFQAYRGGIYQDTRIDQTQAHAITVVGYSDQHQAFKLINSWGERWGIRGYGWVSYEAFAAITRYGFAMTTRMATPVPQPPRPTPPPPVVVVPPAPPTPPVTVVIPKPSPPPPPAPAPTPVVQPPPQPAPTPPPPHLADLPPQLRDIVGAFDCAGIGLLDRNRRLVSAYVGSAEARSDLQAKLAAALPGFKVEVEHRPWPQCEALQTFAEALAAPMGLALTVNGMAGSSRLLKGDTLLLKITTPSYPSYVYAIYLQASGDAVHLVQPRGLVGRQYDPKAEIVLGDGRDAGPRFTVSEPLGSEMIVVVASASPLFDTGQSAATEREFLTRYRKAMLVKAPGQGARRVSAATLSLETAQ